jgi:tyrosyl-tRNA synthetase
MENIVDELKARGLINNFSNEEEIRELLSTPQTVYCGFDPSAASMHIGNFVPISILMRFIQYGHRVIAVVGGATGMIGDPSGKSKERNLQGEDTLRHNTECLKQQLSRFLDFSHSSKALLLDNYDWTKNLTVLDYLRDYGKFFSINYMLSKDIVSSRLEAGISYTEFSYMILQSMDFLKLHDEYNCNIQIGGGDQWGNLTAGLELIRKVKGPEEKVGVMTMNLITRSDGKKFGKSEDGALFLDENLTSPYKMYQFFINQADEDAVKYLKVFTFISLDEIAEIEKEHLANLGQRIAQKRLAFEVVKIIHGEEKANEAKMMSEVLFTDEFSKLTEKEMLEIFEKTMVDVKENSKLEDILIDGKVCDSKREARQLITGNSISLNNKKVTDPNFIVNKEDTLLGKYIVLKKGKKYFFLLRFAE